jgi:hypothetical protein
MLECCKMKGGEGGEVRGTGGYKIKFNFVTL